MDRLRAAGVLLTVFVVLIAGCTDDQSGGDSPQPGWQRVDFEGVSFDVPADWPVETPENWVDFQCTTSRDDGVFLPPPPEKGGYSPICPATLEYGTSVHVIPHDDRDRLEVGPDTVTEGAGDNRRLVNSTPANGWRSVTFVERGVKLVFYEVDDPTYEAIIASMEGSRA